MLQELQKQVDIGICYPGNEIPDWFSYQSCGSSINIQLPQHNGCNRFRGYSNVKLLEDDYATCSVKFEAPDEGQNCKVKYCGVYPVYAKPEIIQSSISLEKFNVTNQAFEETMVEAYTKFPDEADTSARGCAKSTHFINNKAFPLLHHTLCCLYC
ncbi:hypothetical protein Q3G72_027959 [Acer saccharum]|nr:hypothetical protein Q3G72_027959 [Acer saccharum]